MKLTDFIPKRHYRIIDSYTNSVVDINDGVVERVVFCGVKTPLPQKLKEVL